MLDGCGLLNKHRRHAVEQECAVAHCAEGGEEGLADRERHQEVDCCGKALRPRGIGTLA